MSILHVIANLVTLEQNLAITTPIAAQIRAAYPLPPNRAQAPTLPCVINAWTFRTEQWLMGPEQRGEQDYEIHLQFLIQDADLARGAAIATSFFDAFLAALADDPSLGGTADIVTPRGGNPTLALITWNDIGYPGIDLYLDVVILNPGAAVTP